HVRLLALSRREGEARAMRDMQFASACATIATLDDASITLDYAKLLSLPEMLAMRLLAESLCCVSGDFPRPRKHETERLFVHLQETTFSKATLKHCLIEKRGGMLHIASEPHKTKAQRALKPLAASPFWW